MLSWNNNVSSAYRIAFAKERKRGFGVVEIWRVSVQDLSVTIIELYFNPYKFWEYFIWK